jgi:hypothetical protein
MNARNTGCASMLSDPPEVTVKLSSEVETLPTRTTNYNVRNDSRKIEYEYRKRPKNPDIFSKIKKSPGTQI